MVALHKVLRQRNEQQQFRGVTFTRLGNAGNSGRKTGAPFLYPVELASVKMST